MGNKKAKPEGHILHYHRLDENKLWVFYPSNERYDCFPVFTEDEVPFFFGNLETVSVPYMNRIFIIGGTGFKSMPQFTIGGDPNALSKYQRQVVEFHSGRRDTHHG